MFGTGSGSNNTNYEKAGRFLYLINPSTHTYQHIKDVPDFIVDAIPFFMAAIIVEAIISYMKGLDGVKVFYAFNNVAAGMIQQSFKLIHKPFVLVAYCFIYENYKVYELPWDSVWTWYIAFLSVDFFYYWFHRGAHEVNLFWAAHQVHHSSEDMNLTTALRQSFVQKYISALFYSPMAFFIPPSIFFIHSQFNLIYQFWIHTEVIRSLGPLEHILNTASHHRVHHGRNPYCIDKNYGGTLIIWDRIFNTFAWEDETVAYGLVHQQNTTSPWKLQIGHFVYIFKRSWKMDNWHDMLCVIFCGPGWLSESEKSRLTKEEMQLPEVEQPIIQRDFEYFQMHNYRFESVYVAIHFLLNNLIFQEFFPKKMQLSVIETNASMLFFFWTLTSLGFVLENRWFWCLMECLRCCVVVTADAFMHFNGYTNPVLPEIILTFSRLFYLLSIIATFYLACKKSTNKDERVKRE